MKTRLTLMLWLVLAWPALAQVVNYPGSASSGGGGATNGIQMLNGSGTNTVLHNLNVISAAGAYPGDITGTAPYAGTANTYTGVVYTAGVGGPNQVNIGNLKKLKSDMASQVVNIWLFGDDALNPHTSLINSLDRYLYRGGSMLGWDVGPYMGSWYAGTITHPTWAGTVEPFNSYVGMATGSSITNQYNSYGGQINGITTTHVTPLFWKSNSFGTLTVITQSLVNGVLGTPSVLRVIDCNNSSTLTAATTNIYLGGAVPNLTASVYSTGTNMIYGIGQINTNAGSGYNFSQFHGGSFDINNLMTNSFKSNTLRQFMAPFPPSLALFHDGNTSNSLYNGLTLFHDMVANAGYATDIASVTGIPRTNDLATGDGERLSVINWARATGRTAIDTYGLFLPFDVTTFIPYYTSDAVHLTTLGNAVVGGEVVKWLGLDYPGVSAQQQLPKLTVSNLVTATLSHPAGSSGGIRTSNNFYLGWPNNAVRIIDNSTLVPTITAATPTHTLQLYSENNNHGIGLGTASGVTGGYWMSDGNILFVYGNGGAGALRARFDVANSVYSFVGNVVATSGTFIGDGSGLTNLPSGGSTTITNTTSAAGVVTGGSGSFGIGTNLTSVAGGTNSFFVAAAAANSWTNRIGDSWLLSGANSVLTVGTNTGNNTVITDGYGSFANGFWLDAGAQEYFVGKVNVGVNRGDFSLNSGTVSNLTALGTLTAAQMNVTDMYVTNAFFTQTNKYPILNENGKLVGVSKFTNSVTVMDGNGYPAAMTVGSGLSYDSGTKTLTATGGSSPSFDSYGANEVIVENFYGVPNTSFVYGQLGFGYVANSGASGQLDGEAGHNGIFYLSTSTSATAGPILGQFSAGKPFITSSGSYTQEWVLRLPTLPSADEGYEMRVGFGNQQTAAVPADAVYFVLNTNDTHCVLVTRNDTSESRATNDVVISANTWFTNRLVVIGDTSATLTVNGGTATTLSANLPSGSGDPTAIFAQIVKSNGTTARTLQIDSLKFGR